ncbi:SDR family NAD(P)-dependent oxidoreductase [Saccharospirillum impatiens]|uniref:SDR family NAD(P)-dependent oxidoreductase n=1 Tax=Saccharospirillum impatiens TaxID=169438 RepID=UPI0003F99E6D|nr:SDR family NAD(P)-dependent oxidoreductase [Saccharospirillum impatiens]
MFDTLKDYSIVYSFDRTGYQRHARHFSAIDNARLASQRVLITGGTSGIGAALAERLASAGATVWVTGRGQEKFDESGLAKLGVQFIELDMTRFDEVLAQPLPQLDALVCNAGGMPDKLMLVEDRYDVIFASQVVGHYLLIRRCMEQKLLPEGAPVHLTASGGMYLQKLELGDLCWESRRYDKVKSYANAKRAQVILNQELPRLFPGYTFSASHPGWVGTPALREALPGFSSKMGDRLRTSEEGADTIYWCLAEGRQLPVGEFWFDREPRKVYPFFWTRELPQTRQSLLDLCDDAWQRHHPAGA